MKRTPTPYEVKSRAPLAADLGTPSTPREIIIADLLVLFLDTCHALAAADAAGIPVTAEELDQLHHAVASAHAIGVPLADARDFLAADNWHRQTVEMTRADLRRLWTGHTELCALIARTAARRRARVRVSA
ncbi:MAG: hypothetical protein ACK5ZR_02560 [Gemmatimonadaceae bacterium]|jgi:hypothetical protein